MPQTIAELVAAPDATAPAIGAPDRLWLDFAGLRAQGATTAAALHRAGIGRGDRVAIVLPNGPEMAAAFLTVAQAAVTCPLNPAYRREEFDFYLGDLGACAIILAEGEAGAAHAAAVAAGLAILRLSAAPGGAAGQFSLRAEGAARRTPDVTLPGPGDVALILHTSGTTSRPKIVPLLHSNIAASARHIAASLALSPMDRCLNMMPLFHIHGLIAAVTASLGAGASVWCAPGFDALRFFGWLEAARPSWYTAVPTMHQTILARAGRNADVIARVPLRLIRSSSASLPAQVMRDLQRIGLAEKLGLAGVQSGG